jgi:hypothetical protein
MKNNQEFQVEEFVNWVRTFCELIEQRDAYSKHSFIHNSAKVLSVLYYSALTLSEVEPVNSIANRSYITIDERAKVHREIGMKLGDFNLYWEIFNPYEHVEPVCGSIGDDLGDIYYDIKDGLELYKKESESDIIEAVWHWRFSFYTHFSTHIAALRAINHIIMEE